MPRGEYKTLKPTTAALTIEQAEALKALSGRTRIPQQVLIREAIDDLLKKHKQPMTKRRS